MATFEGAVASSGALEAGHTSPGVQVKSNVKSLSGSELAKHESHSVTIKEPKTEERESGRSWHRKRRGKVFSFRTMKSYIHPDYSAEPNTIPSHNRSVLPEAKFSFRTPRGELIKTHQEVAMYLSPTRDEPRKMLVQCTEAVWNASKSSNSSPNNRDWRIVRMKGSVPTVMLLSEWAMRPADGKKIRGSEDSHSAGGAALSAIKRVPGFVLAFGRILLVAPFIQLFLAIPGLHTPWQDDADPEEKYENYPGYVWEWPEFSVNMLDMGRTIESLPGSDAKFSAKPRQLRPHTLIVWEEATGWKKVDDPSPLIPYVVASFTRAHFHVDSNKRYGQSEEQALAARAKLEDIAQYATMKYFKSDRESFGGSSSRAKSFGYWIDYQCGSENAEARTRDINTICDTVRSARSIIVCLPEDPKLDEEGKSPIIQTWDKYGKSLWTLSEVLLANGDIKFCWPLKVDDTSVLPKSFGTAELSKLEMTHLFWADSRGGQEQHVRLLAEHFSGTLTLSRIELFTTALAALEERVPEEANRGLELAPALMALFHYRIDPDNRQTMFHSLAKLSMVNDNDDLIERMICWAPSIDPDTLGIWKQEDMFARYSLSAPDLFGSRLWDIKPKCRIVGLAKDHNTVMINGSRAIHIRWKDFPRLKFQRSYGLKKIIAEYMIRSAALWVAGAVALAFAWIPSLLILYKKDTAETVVETNRVVTVALILFVLAVALVLSLFGPQCIRRMYGGEVTESNAQLIAFEGTLPRSQIETMIFGNNRDRLVYQASATTLVHPEKELRGAQQPSWVDDVKSATPSLWAKHRLFTLVDTGNRTITIFSAEKPPTVALLCGIDGGMLRAVLCSWSPRSNCLYKEAVIRMPEEVWENATVNNWLKLCLDSRAFHQE